MYKKIIEKYVSILTIDDIKTFSLKEGINPSNEDIDTIYFYIKNYWQMIYENPNDIFKELKAKLNENTYSKVISLYNKYKNKIY